MKSRMVLAPKSGLRAVICLAKINNLTCDNNLFWFNNQTNVDNHKKINPDSSINPAIIIIKCRANISDLS